MMCLSMEITSHLLLLLTSAATVGAFPPIKQTWSDLANGSMLSSKFHNGPMDLVQSRHVPEKYTIDSVQEHLHSTLESTENVPSTDSNYLGTSAQKLKPHRIKNRSSNSNTVSRRTASDFVFPTKTNSFTPQQDVKNCSLDGIDLCVSNVWDYPYQHIERMLKSKTFNFRSYFTDDVVLVSTRFDESVDDEMVCAAEEKVLYPKFGKTASDEMLFIINSDDTYRQGVRVEKCKKSGESPCNAKLVTPAGYRTYCKQKYIYRKLLALHPNGEPAPNNFRVPSCCSCHVSSEMTAFRRLIKRAD